MKLRALLVICLLMPFAASLSNADDIDNMCLLNTADGGWAGICVNDLDWQAGWYVYRHGTTWTRNNLGWLASTLDDVSKTVSTTTRTVDHPPRGTRSGNNEPLPTTQTPFFEHSAITTHYPDGTTITAITGTNSTIVTLPDGSVVRFDHSSGTRTEITHTGQETSRTYK